VLFNIVSNISNGVGLERCYRQLRHELEARGHQVQGVQFNAKPFRISPADVNIFDEIVNLEALKAAPVSWIMPHPEWWFGGWDTHLVHFDKVLAKTRDCERIFKQKVGDKCQFLGWMPRDLYQPDIPRERKFLHIAGKSQMKNTREVIQGCKIARVPLTVVSEHYGPRSRVPEDEIHRLMNSHFCQVMPSAYEGYGHVLREARAVGQVVITTDAAPMNELSPAILVPSCGTHFHHAGELHRVSPHDVAKAVRQVMAMSDAEVEALRAEGREEFHKEVAAFQQALDELVGRA
jgi:glycosyltransferase involved in cell wall biosynthesis